MLIFICSFEIKIKENIKSVLYFFSICSDFYEFLLNRFYKSSFENIKEIMEIFEEVLKIV